MAHSHRHRFREILFFWNAWYGVNSARGRSMAGNIGRSIITYEKDHNEGATGGMEFDQERYCCFFDRDLLPTLVGIRCWSFRMCSTHWFCFNSLAFLLIVSNNKCQVAFALNRLDEYTAIYFTQRFQCKISDGRTYLLSTSRYYPCSHLCKVAGLYRLSLRERQLGALLPSISKVPKEPRKMLIGHGHHVWLH